MSAESSHELVTANTGAGIVNFEAGHLRYQRGRGVVKIEEADCDLCVEQGLNDGQWHEVTTSVH